MRFLAVASLAVSALCLMSGCAAAPVEEPSGAATIAFEAAACTAATVCDGLLASNARATRAASCTLLVTFDGSGVYSPDVGSNVGVLYEEATVARVYVEGVPSLPFGASAERVLRGRRAVCEHLAAHEGEDCDVVLLGYSRGAFIANQLAHALNDEGCADGTHVGQRIAFLGAFDPVNKQMGTEWKDASGASQAWAGDVPPNVENVVQIYKDPKVDPRGGLEGLTLTTTLLSTDSVTSSCRAAMTTANHPDGKAWHHGEVGHFELPRSTMACALERAGLPLTARKTD